MKDNKGFSIVELLVAITIAAIVAGSIGYLLVTSLNMYGNELSDVSMQQEVGTAYNIIESYIKEAQFIAVGNYEDYVVDGTGDDSTLVSCRVLSDKTRFLVLGNVTRKFDDSPDVRDYVSGDFSGVIIVADENVSKTEYTGGEPGEGCLYMQVVDSDKDRANGKEPRNLTNYAEIEAEIQEMMNNKNQYLLATNVQNFYVVPENMAPNSVTELNGKIPGVTATPKEGYDKYSIWESEDYTNENTGVTLYAPKYYKNNISLKVNLTVASKGATKIESKTISESVMIRNYITKDIIINDKKYKEYNNALH